MFWSLNKGFWSWKKCWRPCRTNVLNSINWVLIYSEIHNLKYIFSNHANMSIRVNRLLVFNLPVLDWNFGFSVIPILEEMLGSLLQILDHTLIFFTLANSFLVTHVLYSCKFFSGDSYSALMQILYFSLMFPLMRILC